MNKVIEATKTTERRWNHIGPLYLCALVTPSVFFESRLFHSGSWHYPVEFVFWAGLMLYLVSRLRFAYRPIQHISPKAFCRLQLRSGALVALPMAAYVSFFEYSSHETSLFGLCLVACATFLTFIIGAVSLINPPILQSSSSSSQDELNMTVGHHERHTSST